MKSDVKPPYQRAYPQAKDWRVPAAPAQAATPQAAAADFVLTPDFRVVLAENFTTSNLDTNRWWTRYAYNDGWLDFLNDEASRYREAGNHVMTGARCDLTALPFTDGWYYPSGMIRSKDCFDIANGDAWYFDCRAKIPKGKGIWTAFWLAGSERVPGDDSSIPWPPEIDVMEIVNNEQDDKLNMLHCNCQVLDWDSNPQGYSWTQWIADYNTQWSYWWAPYDFSDAFHNFALLYQRPNFTMFCDRKLILSGTYDWVADDGNVMPGAYLFTNLAIGGQWAGRYGIDDSAFPQAMEVEYIHVYQKVAQSTIGHDLMPNGG